jgi:hypothetical protein
VKWLSALLLGAILGFLVPLMLGGQAGLWMDTWVKWGTIRPIPTSPGMLFSIPIFLGSAIALRLFFNWHKG